jgi:hypothetical protein
LIIGILVLFSLIFIGNIERSWCFHEVYYLESDKVEYNSDEIIRLNSSWGLFYETGKEICYIQIRIFNTCNEIIWNSSIYSEQGYFFYKQWNISIISLDLLFENFSSTLEIKFYYYCFDIDNQILDEVYSNELKIRIFKKNISCHFNYSERFVEYGKSLILDPQFTEKDLDGNEYLLRNNPINLEILWNGSLIYSTNLVTNELGQINFNLSTYTHLNVGVNKIIFTIEESIIYYRRDFNFSIEVIKNNVTCQFDILDNSPQYGENIVINPVFFKVGLDGIRIPLRNYTITLNILWNTSLTYSSNLSTNDLGQISINLSTYAHLKVGDNIISFSLVESIYNFGGIFNYNIEVQKADIYTEIFDLSKDKISESIEFKVFYYYLINGKISPLKNQSLTLKINFEETDLCVKTLCTNESGYVKVILNLSELNFTKIIKTLNISLIFNGTEELNENKLLKIIEVSGDRVNYENYTSFYFFLSLSLIIGILCILSIIAISKRKKKVKIADVTLTI